MLQNHGFRIIGKLDINQYIFPYTFNQTSAMTCELFGQSSFSQRPSTPLKNRIICLIRIHALTASITTLTIVVIPSDLSHCQVFSSAYFYTFCFCLYFYKFQYFCVFIVVRWPMLAAHWLFTSRWYVPNLVISLLICFKSVSILHC